MGDAEAKASHAPGDGSRAVGSAPAGWYADPSDPAMARYWDGAAWGVERQLLAAFGARGAGRAAPATAVAVESRPRPRTPEPGWYADPTQPGAERYWDGTAWTPQLRARASPATSAPPQPAVADSGQSLRDALPAYEIGAELGRGAFGIVVAARHRQLGREVAIKQLSPGLVHNAEVRSRFLSEAQVLASIDHPHIVPVYDYVERGDVCALVMERLVGGTVWRRFVDHGFDHQTACAIALVACSGLQGAHERGVLHRDMKPENILFGTDRTLKVTDFGIARVLGENDALTTRGGGLLGTPAYMAPEQASGTDLGPPTDVYATGVMLYEMLSGRLPFSEDGGTFAIVMRHLNEDPVPLARIAPTVPPQLAEAVDVAVTREPGLRFASADQFGVAIAEAAGAAWGPGWLDRLDVTLRAPGPILTVVQRASAGGAPGGGASAVPAGGGQVVRPAIELHTGGAADSRVILSDLMPLRQKRAELPSSPTGLIWAAAALAALAVLLGLFGVGSLGSTSAGAVPTGAVSVGGHDISSGRPAPLDLNRPVTVTVDGRLPGVGVPRSARLTLSLAGLGVVHSVASSFTTGLDGSVATLDLTAGRYVVGGTMPASLQLDGSTGSVHERFEVRATRAPVATFLGLFVVVLALIVAAYAESFLRSLRRGRRRRNQGAVAGLVVAGAFAGLTSSLAGWLIGLSVPTPTGLVAPTVVGAAAGLVAGLAASRVGARARARRQANRLVLVARRTTTEGALAVPALVGT